MRETGRRVQPVTERAGGGAAGTGWPEEISLRIPRERTKQGTLLLVNRWTPLQSRITEEELTGISGFQEPLPRGGFRTLALEQETARMLRFALQSLSRPGRIILVSGYREEWEQRELYETSLVENGEVFTRSYVAHPGCSEHETGLAVDLGEFGEEIDYIRPSFPYTGICQEFREKAAAYGFVERYEKEKKKLTGISPEPWHFRYVGMPHARIMKAQGMCLEEYLDYLQKFPMDRRELVWMEDSWEFSIGYACVEGEEITLQVPENRLYQISGDNREGLIRTVWRRI